MVNIATDIRELTMVNGLRSLGPLLDQNEVFLDEQTK